MNLKPENCLTLYQIIGSGIALNRQACTAIQLFLARQDDTAFS